MTAAQIESASEATGRAMRDLGVTLTLAPMLDWFEALTLGSPPATSALT